MQRPGLGMRTRDNADPGKKSTGDGKGGMAEPSENKVVTNEMTGEGTPGQIADCKGDMLENPKIRLLSPKPPPSGRLTPEEQTCDSPTREE